VRAKKRGPTLKEERRGEEGGVSSVLNGVFGQNDRLPFHHPLYLSCSCLDKDLINQIWIVKKLGYAK